MKYGMNLLLWATAVDESHDGILEQIKQIGFDGVEVPIFEHDAGAFERLGGKLDELGLGRTAVTVSTEDANPISPDASIRAEAVKSCIDVCAHVHISENDRSTPGSGGVDWDTSFAALKEVGYDGWMVVEAFGLALPDLAAATKIWRRMYESEEQLARDALAFMKQQVEQRRA